MMMKAAAHFPQECHLILGAKVALAFLSVSLSLTKDHKTRDLGLDDSQMSVYAFVTLHLNRKQLTGLSFQRTICSKSNQSRLNSLTFDEYIV